jgi:hypothetical protein
MSLSNAAETALLNLLFNNTDWANIGDAGGLQNSATAGSFFLSLHTADPGEAGNQSTNETNYTSYARVAVARSSAGWTISGDVVSNTALVQFPACTGGSSTVTHWGLGTASSGTGNLICSGPLTASLAVSSGIQPQFAAGDLDITAD